MTTAWFNGIPLLLILGLLWQQGLAARWWQREPRVSHVSPKTGSKNGGTRLTIYGAGFSKNQFNFGPGNDHLGNKVELINGAQTQSYTCDVHKDGSHETQIQCYTRPMPEGLYYLRVWVDDKKIPDSETCGGGFAYNCKYWSHRHSTPTIDSVTPNSGPPGTIVKLEGVIFTTRIGSNEEASQNNKKEMIRRVYLGGSNCELRKENNPDEVYGIQLRSSSSNYGWFKCKLGGTFVGHYNASFLIEGAYGRSMPHKRTKHISGNQKLAMFQSYALLRNVLPSVGSTVGGTKLSIHGKYFDETNGKVRVYVAGKKCTVTEPIRDELIVCRTPVAPSMTLTAFPGNRGSWRELWNDTINHHNTLPLVTNYTSSASDYSSYFIDKAGFDELSIPGFNDYYVTRIKGFFVPPLTSDYKFYLDADDAAIVYFSQAGPPENKEKILECPLYCGGYSYKRYTTQKSKRFTLSANESYYFEILQNEYGGYASAHFGVKVFDTKYVSSQSEDVRDEKQRLVVSSDDDDEKQMIHLENWAEGPHTKEVQRARVVSDGGAGGFRLGKYGVYTAHIPLGASGSVLKDELNKLPFMDDTVSVTRTTVTNGYDYRITYNTLLGDVEELDHLAEASMGVINITVTEVTKGVGSGKKLAFTIDGIPSPSVNKEATAAEVETALKTLFSIRCPSTINPSGQKQNTFYDFESDGPWKNWGQIDGQAEPYCGLRSLKNPSYIFKKEGNNIATYTYRKICFAYKGSFHQTVKIYYDYKDDKQRYTSNSFSLSLLDNGRWNYLCFNVQDALTTKRPTALVYSFKLVSVRLYPKSSTSDVHVDNVLLVKGANDPLPDIKELQHQRMRGARPGGMFLNTLTVLKGAPFKYNITWSSFNCAYDMELFGVLGVPLHSGSRRGDTASATYRLSSWSSQTKVHVSRLVAASPPVTGTFDYTYKSETRRNIPAAASAFELQQTLRTIKDYGHLTVSRQGRCSRWTYDLHWPDMGGEKELPSLNFGNLGGRNAMANASKVQSGGVFYKIIPGDMIRTFEEKPQVQLFINNIPVACLNEGLTKKGNCSFEWKASGTPTITAIAPTAGSAMNGTKITITGTNFANNTETMNDPSTVTIKGYPCVIDSYSDTEIVCSVGQGPPGVFRVKVYVQGKGLALHAGGDKNFTYTAEVTSINPTSGSAGGGLNITISGHGFAKGSTVSIGGKPCPIQSISYQEIQCRVPPKSKRAANVSDVIVHFASIATTSPTKFTYDSSSQPTISMFSPTSSFVPGGDALTIVGTNFGASPAFGSKVTIGGTPCVITNWTDTQIEVTLPAHAPGEFAVDVFLGSLGSAVNDLPDFKYLLEVTDIQPERGSFMGGTCVVIKGNGFDTNKTGNIVKIGDTNCKVQSSSATEINCVTEPTVKRYRVTNFGIHPIHGIMYAWKPRLLTVEVGDSVLWQWSIPIQVKNAKYFVQQTANASASSYDGSGFISGHSPSPNAMDDMLAGAFEYKFTVPGEYHYWSGPVNSQGNIVLRGVVYVKGRNSTSGKLSVKRGGFEAIHNKTAGATITSNGGCLVNASLNAGCNDVEPIANDTSKLNFLFYTCSTPVVTSIEPVRTVIPNTINITGRGFSAVNSETEIRIGGQLCIPQPATSSASRLHCLMSHNATLRVGIPHLVHFHVAGKGKAFLEIRNELMRRVIFDPHITGLSHRTGSTQGGTKLTIFGAGFSEPLASTSVRMGSIDCPITSLTYTHIECTTPGQSDGTTVDVTVRISAGGNLVQTQCITKNCTYSYATAMTPHVVAVTPQSVSTYSTEIAITGTGFGTATGDVIVTIGNHACSVRNLTDSLINCTVGYVTVGNQPLKVHVLPKGDASSAAGSITSVARIDSVTPARGSTNGGTNITINGNGFKVSDVSVTIGGVTCDITAVSISSLACVTRAKVAGASKVQVTSNWVNYPQEDYIYDASQTPEITSTNPPVGNSGATFTLSGTGFSNTSYENVVTIDGAACMVTSSSNTSIQCILGAHSAGTYGVVLLVKGKGLATSSAQFSYDINVTSINPSSGSFAGGQNITISGTGFDSSNTNVTICGHPCNIFYPASSTEIVCQTPPHAGNDSQQCDVIVKVNNAMSNNTGGYTYRDALTPAITSVSPLRGGTGGGTSLTINGTGFIASPKEDNVVTIDGAACTVTFASTTQIICTTGSHTGTLKTKVRINVGTNGMAKQDFADFWYIDVWSSPWTWGGRNPPIKGDFVIIKKGQTVLLDIDTPVFAILLVQGGHLIFDEADILLQAEKILITDGGSLTIGTEAEPFQHNATILLHGHLRSKELPIYGTKMIALREGTLDLHGKPIPVTWTHLAATANAGDNIITLKESVNWDVGQEIVLPTTSHRHSQRENEKHIIAAISNDGRTLTLRDPLKYTHISVMENLCGRDVETRGEVGLLSRNIVVRGNDDPQWHDVIKACPAGFDTGEFATQTCFQGRFGEEIGSNQFGAHILIHAPRKDEHLSIARIEYIEVTFAGQAFQLGRYPIHFHLNGNMSLSYVRGCGIHKTFNRAVNVHGVHNMVVEDNVAFDVMGGAFFLEDGIETGNIFQRNLAVFVRSSTSLLNDDITPAAFWITNPNNIVRLNAAAGGTHFGFWYRMHAHPSGPSFTRSVCQQSVPLGEFRNNTVHSQGWFGLWIFQTYFPKKGGLCSSTEPLAAKFYSLTTWNCEKGAEWVDAAPMQFIDFVMINNQKRGIEMKMARNGGTEKVKKFTPEGFMIKDSLIVGHSNISAAGECTSQGLNLPYDSGLLVSNVCFVNFDRPGCAENGITSITGTTSAFNGGFGYHFENITHVSSPHRAAFRWEHEGFFLDRDGTLTGQAAGSRVIPSSGLLPSHKCAKSALFSQGFNAKICQPDVRFIRQSFNHPHPSSLRYKNAIFRNPYGNSSAPWSFKRVTHKEGWMALLVANVKTFLMFENAGHLTNISYDGIYYEMEDPDFIIGSLPLDGEPDRVSLYSGQVARKSNTSISAVNKRGDYHYENSTGTFDFMITNAKGNRRKRAAPGMVDQNIRLRTEKCYFKGCITPSGGKAVAHGGRPDDAEFWSTVTDWTPYGLSAKPVTGNSLTVPKDKWLVVDEPLPPHLGQLVLYGTLELDDRQNINGSYPDHNLNVSYIYIIGGKLIAGWENSSFNGTASITLRGTHKSPKFQYPGSATGPPLGSKFIGVFGGLELFGKVRKPVWTRLNSTAKAKTKKIKLETAVDWVSGEEIVITPTGFNAWETETHVIDNVEADGMTITLKKALAYDHLGGVHEVSPGVSYKMAAEVGLLTRNIKIIGDTYINYIKESYGARVVVGVGVDKDGDVHKGFARLSNVEFFRTGQEGYTEPYDPRFSLAFLGLGTVTDSPTSSFSKECSFHHGFSPAIGAFGTNRLVLEDNIVHHTVGPSIQLEGSRHIIKRNLVTLLVWPGAYLDRREVANFDWPGGFELTKTSDIALQHNVVAGSERSGFKITGEPCDVSRPSSDEWKGNVAHTVLAGVDIFPGTAISPCTKVSNFYVYKALDFGIYLQAGPSMLATGLTLVDNQVGFFPMVIGPGSLSHIRVDKKIELRDSLIVGQSPFWNCASDRAPSNDDNIKLSPQGRSFSSRGGAEAEGSTSGGKVGVAMGTFMSGGNGAPRKPWKGLKSYPTIGGLTVVQNVHFAHYTVNSCGKRDIMFEPNPSSGDATHPMRTSVIKKTSCDQKSYIYLPRPALGLINPSDCVDMDCDGMKKILVDDLDGSLVGSIGTITPQSEFQWNGDRRRGLGDYRIPKVMLTALDGKRIQVNSIAPHKGIIRNGTCGWDSVWQAYKCHGLDHEMMIIESLDKDTELRRLSPVAVLGDGYLDLLNGPMDHGWCAGYTCQKRISTFYAVVATGKHYDIFFTSTSPQNLRLQLLNSASNQRVRVAVYYSNPQRLDIYKKGAYVSPNNAHLDNDGNVVYKPVTTPGEFVPTIYQPGGANWFDQKYRMQYVILQGNDAVDIRMVPVVVVSFNLPAVTLDEFYGPKLANYLALFLGIDAKRIRVVEIVSANGGRRKKRSTPGTVELEISSPPSNGTMNETGSQAESARAELQQHQRKIVNAIQLGSMETVLNTTILGVNIQPVVAAVGSADWESAANSTEERSQDSQKIFVQIPKEVVWEKIAEVQHEGAPFKVPITLKMVDAGGNPVFVLGSEKESWDMTATLRPLNLPTVDSRATLLGNTTVKFDQGIATFTSLAISHSGSGYVIDFKVTSPPEAANRTQFQTTLTGITVKERPLTAKFSVNNTYVRVNETFSASLHIIDAVTKSHIKNITWKGHTWVVSMTTHASYTGDLSGDQHLNIPASGHALFSGLILSKPGYLTLKFNVTTRPASSYSFSYETSPIRVVSRDFGLTPQVSKQIVMKFKGDYDVIIRSQSDHTNFALMMNTYLESKYPNVTFWNTTITKGSIVVTMVIQGSEKNVNLTLALLETMIMSGYAVSFNGVVLKSLPFLSVDGVQRTKDTTVKPAPGAVLSVVALVIIILMGVLMISIVIGLLIYFKMKGGKKFARSISPEESSDKLAINQEGYVRPGSGFAPLDTAYHPPPKDYHVPGRSLPPKPTFPSPSKPKKMENPYEQQSQSPPPTARSDRSHVSVSLAVASEKPTGEGRVSPGRKRQNSLTMAD